MVIEYDPANVLQTTKQITYYKIEILWDHIVTAPRRVAKGLAYELSRI